MSTARIEEVPTILPELLGRLSEARLQTDELFAIVRQYSLYERPIAERHRIVFYIGHLEAFDWNLLRERVFGLGSFNADYDKLFAFGIDPVGGGLPTDQPKDWPSIEDVRGYVSEVRSRIDENLARLDPVDLFAKPDREGSSPGTLLNVAIEHRLMHAETLAYMLHQLPHRHKVPHARKPSLVTAPIAPEMISIPAGRATLGLSRRAAAFGWDNEFEEHQVEVPAFRIDNQMVSNGQYLEFVDAGGYEDPAFWSPSDWEWKSAGKISHPVFWNNADGPWHFRTMFDDIPLPLDWPVYVSHAEAAAFARWAGKSLPTEAQWHRAAYGAPDEGERQFPWGSELPTTKRGNFDFRGWDPTPAGAFPEGRSAFGLYDLLGNGWEWTSTLFQPFSNFQPFPFYRGYSADFFDGKHYVIKGGSARTAASMLRRSFRNWFQPHYQYVYAGFRCVAS